MVAFSPISPVWSLDPAGRLDEHVINSVALEGNHLGDSAERPLWVMVPKGYDESASKRYPVIYVLQGYTGFLQMWANREPYSQPYLVTADQVVNGGKVPPVIVVFVDAWTTYGGSQFVDSIGTGRYHSYLCDDVVPWVDGHYRTLPDPAHRGVQGKSSGGFGAMITPMLRPDLFGALASHAGDALYELCYARDFGTAARALRSWDGDITKWWENFAARQAFTDPADEALISFLGVGACFSADEAGNVLLPFDVETGQVVPEVWDRWLAWDPVRMVEPHATALRGLRGIWIDAGRSDDYFLDLGALAVRRELAKVGVLDTRFELFDGTHAGISYRYPMSLSWLAQTLA